MTTTNEYTPVPLTLSDVIATTFRTLGAHVGPIFLMASAISVPTTAPRTSEWVKPTAMRIGGSRSPMSY